MHFSFASALFLCYWKSSNAVIQQYRWRELNCVKVCHIANKKEKEHNNKETNRERILTYYFVQYSKGTAFLHTDVTMQVMAFGHQCLIMLVGNIARFQVNLRETQEN